MEAGNWLLGSKSTFRFFVILANKWKVQHNAQSACDYFLNTENKVMVITLMKHLEILCGT